VFVCILPVKAVPEMTYTMSDGTLNPTYSLTRVGRLFLMWPPHVPRYGYCSSVWRLSVRLFSTGS